VQAGTDPPYRKVRHLLTGPGSEEVLVQTRDELELILRDDGPGPPKEALRLIRDKKWNMQATIEFEYPVPPGSDRMAEMAKCIQYCRTALAT